MAEDFLCIALHACLPFGVFLFVFWWWGWEVQAKREEIQIRLCTDEVDPVSFFFGCLEGLSELFVCTYNRESVLHQKRPKVALLKKLLLNANIISTLDHLSRDSKAVNKLVVER